MNKTNQKHLAVSTKHSQEDFECRNYSNIHSGFHLLLLLIQGFLSFAEHLNLPKLNSLHRNCPILNRKHQNTLQ